MAIKDNMTLYISSRVNSPDNGDCDILYSSRFLRLLVNGFFIPLLILQYYFSFYKNDILDVTFNKIMLWSINYSIFCKILNIKKWKTFLLYFLKLKKQKYAKMCRKCCCKFIKGNFNVKDAFHEKTLGLNDQNKILLK